MKIHAIIARLVATALCASSVSAQQLPSDVTVARKTCQQHTVRLLLPGSSAPTFENGWEHCTVIEAAYQKSEEAAAARKAAAAAEADRQMTKALADKIK